MGKRPRQPDTPLEPGRQLRLHRCGFLDYDEMVGVRAVASVVDATDGNPGPAPAFVALRVNGEVEVRAAPHYQTVYCVPAVGAELEAGEDLTSIAATTFSPTKDLFEGGIVRPWDGNDTVFWVAGLDGRIVAWSARHRTVLSVLDAGGGAVWALSIARVDKSGPDGESDVLLAVASEDGRVRVFDISLLSRTLEASSTDVHPHALRMISESATKRSVSLAWSPCGQFVYSGDANGAIRRISISTGRPSLSLSITHRGIGSVIWAIALLGASPEPNDGRILVAGDSRGVVSVWDTVTGTTLGARGGEYRIEGLQGDITALCVTANGRDVFVGAANGGVGVLRRGVGQGGDDWSTHRARLLHAADVRAMCAHQNRVVVGGLDGRMSVLRPEDYFDEKPVKRLFPVARSKLSVVNVAHRTVLVRHADRVDLWMFGSAETDASAPRLVLRVKPFMLGGPLVCAAVNEEHTCLVVSGPDRTRAFAMYPSGTGPSLRLSVAPIRESLADITNGDFSMSGDSPPLRSVIPFKGDQFLGLSKDGSMCFLMKCGNGKRSFGVTRTWYLSDWSPAGTQLTAIGAALTGDRFACSDGRFVYVFTRRTGWDVPMILSACSRDRERNRVCSLAWSRTNPALLAVAALDKCVKVIELRSSDDGESIVEAPWSAESDSLLVRRAVATPSPPDSVHFLDDGCLFVCGHDFAALISTRKPLKLKEPKLPAKGKLRRPRKVVIPEVFVLSREPNILGCAVFNSNELLLAGKEWREIIPALPDPIPRKQFGQ